jgi:hypothetical protein
LQKTLAWRMAVGEYQGLFTHWNVILS